jgi:hypothetical protein
MSTTTLTTSGVLQDYGSTYGTGTVTHYLTLYKHSSGARVFGAGTIQWSWGLDANHDRGNTAADPRMQQATVNLLADMGAQPATLQSGLVAASASTDVTPPSSAVTSPTAGSTVPLGAVTITGTASDTGGGVVGGVEVSVDGGTTWHPASGRGAWSYLWSPTSGGSANIRSRAVDDSGNIESPSAGVTVTVGGSQTCPCTIWPSAAAPTVASDPDTGSVNVGVKFKSDVNGFITGIRFYKGTANTGTHVGTLWTSGGTQLATATFTNETASGWQQVNFASPVAVTANTVYVASYLAPNGGYAGDNSYFANAGVDRPPLHALQNGVSGGNGVYAYGAATTFPNSTFGSANYWVDVVFTTSGVTDTTPPTVTANTPANGAAGVSTGSTVTATFSEALDATTINGNTFVLSSASGAVTATVTYNAATQVATLTPNAALAASTAYMATLKGGTTDPRVKDLAGNALAANVSWSFTTGAAAVCPCSVWPSSATPANASANDPNGVNLGMKFTSDQAGFITGIRFYKGTGNTGTHVGSLWTSAGVLLASATFSGETATGWQQVSFATPVAIAANTVYVASYFAPNGGYAYDGAYFATSGVDRAPLHALSNSAGGGNGVYQYGATSSFPSAAYNATNYWVDVVFSP